MALRFVCSIFLLIFLSFLMLGIIVEDIYLIQYKGSISDCCGFYRKIYIIRNPNLVDIAIVTVVMNGENYDNYKLAQDLFHCYAIYHKYRWLVVDISSNATLQSICPQKDFMFRRHCVLVEVMRYIEAKWILFIDADMSVINPNHLIEEWIDENYNIILYSRIFNFEIAAGSYLVRNTPYSRRFLRYWADYEFKLPNSFHGTDNGAIHSVVLDTVQPHKKYEKEQCEKFWRQSRSYTDLSIYEACVMHVLGPRKSWPRKVKILNKTKGWARDTWLTNSVWSNRDFVLHGWQMKKLNKAEFGCWKSPLTSHKVNLSLCSTEKAHLNWAYKHNYIRSQNEVQSLLNKFIDTVAVDYAKTLNNHVLRFLKE